MTKSERLEAKRYQLMQYGMMPAQSDRMIRELTDGLERVAANHWLTYQTKTTRGNTGRHSRIESAEVLVSNAESVLVRADVRYVPHKPEPWRASDRAYVQATATLRTENDDLAKSVRNIFDKFNSGLFGRHF